MNSTEYNDHRYFRLSDRTLHMNMSDADLQANYVQGVSRGVAIVRGLIRSLKERLEDLPDGPIGVGHGGTVMQFHRCTPSHRQWRQMH